MRSETSCRGNNLGFISQKKHCINVTDYNYPHTYQTNINKAWNCYSIRVWRQSSGKLFIFVIRVDFWWLTFFSRGFLSIIWQAIVSFLQHVCFLNSVNPTLEDFLKICPLKWSDSRLYIYISNINLLMWFLHCCYIRCCNLWCSIQEAKSSVRT